METLHTVAVADAYDDPNIGSTLSKVASEMPGYVKSSPRLIEEELASLPDSAFAAVIFERSGVQHRKWPLIDAAHVWLAAYYWKLSEGQVPDSVRAVAAYYILDAAVSFGITDDIPHAGEIEAVAASIPAPPTNVVNFGATGGRTTQGTRSDRRPFQHAVYSPGVTKSASHDGGDEKGKKHRWVAPAVAGYGGMVGGMAAGGALAPKGTFDAAAEQIAQAQVPHIQALFGKMDDRDARGVMKEMYNAAKSGLSSPALRTWLKYTGVGSAVGTAAGVGGVMGYRKLKEKKHEKKAAAATPDKKKSRKAEGAAAVGAMVGMGMFDAPRKAVSNATDFLKHAEGVFALPGQRRYPIHSAALVKQAAAYFERYENDLDVAHRFEMARNIIKQANQLGVDVSGRIEKYASCRITDVVPTHIEMRLRYANREGFPKQGAAAIRAMVKVAKDKSSDPYQLMRLVVLFDKTAGLQKFWGKELPDPAATFAGGHQKLAGAGEYVCMLDGKPVTRSQVAEAAKAGSEKLAAAFGVKLASALASGDPDAFRGLPERHRRVVLAQRAG
jgi:hypothetical protein